MLLRDLLVYLIGAFVAVCLVASLISHPVTTLNAFVIVIAFALLAAGVIVFWCAWRSLR